MFLCVLGASPPLQPELQVLGVTVDLTPGESRAVRPTAAATQSASLAHTLCWVHVDSFSLADINFDDYLATDEVRALWPTVAAAEFAEFDSNGDGFLDIYEFLASDPDCHEFVEHALTFYYNP